MQAGRQRRSRNCDERPHGDAQYRTGQDCGAGRKPEQHITPARQRQCERMDVAATVIGSPGRNRDEQAKRGGEQWIQGSP